METVTGRGCDGGMVVWGGQFRRVSPDSHHQTWLVKQEGGSSGWGGSDGIYIYRDCWRSRGDLSLFEESFEPLETV